MKFLVDNQLPMKLAAHLLAKGDDCTHVFDVGMGQAGDIEVWKHADAEGRVLISKDEDFLFLAHRPGDIGRLVWVRLGNCRNDTLFRAFDLAHRSLIEALEGGQRVVELR